MGASVSYGHISCFNFHVGEISFKKSKILKFTRGINKETYKSKDISQSIKSQNTGMFIIIRK